MGEISHHEIALYFLVTLPDDAHPDLSAKFHCEESGIWFEFAALMRSVGSGSCQVS